MFRMLAVLVVMTCSTVAIASSPSAAKLVRVSLINDATAIATKHTVTVGVRYQIEPGWHIYWKNPGDSGTPTQVSFELPSGFSSTDISFPTPRVLSEPGDITIYGFEDEVALLSTISVPQDWDLSKPIPISVNTNFLVCREICLPGSAKLAATINPTSADQSSKDEIRKWNAACPRPIHVDVNSTAQADGSTNLIVRGPANDLIDGGKLKLIPGPSESLVVRCESIKVLNGSFEALLRIAPLPGSSVKQKQLECLITEESSDSRTLTGVSFTVPLDKDAKVPQPTTRP